MDWTEQRPPTEGVSHYDHIDCETHFGLARIEWKSWKEEPSYSITIDGTYVTEIYEDLQIAKDFVYVYIHTHAASYFHKTL